MRHSPQLADEHEGTLFEGEGFGPVLDEDAASRAFLGKWLKGSIISFFVIWAITAYTTDHPLPYTFDPEVNRIVTAPGTYLSANEGYAFMRSGRYGLTGLPDAKKVIDDAGGNWVAVWGDSYVEGRHVADRFKMANVATELWNADASNEPMAFIGIGMGGWTLADVYFHMPTYERLFGPAKAHLIVISEVSDLVPDRFEREAMFVSKPEFGFVPSKWKPNFRNLKMTLSAMKLGFAWELFRENSEGPSLRFRPGPVPRVVEGARPIIVPEKAGVEFLVDSLAQRVHGEIGFLVLSRVPGLLDAELQLSDPSAEGSRVLKEVCDERGKLMGTMFDDFVEFARREKQFPRGFRTRYIGSHLNRYGHRLVADRLIAMTKQLLPHSSSRAHQAKQANSTTENNNAVHPN